MARCWIQIHKPVLLVWEVQLWAHSVLEEKASGWQRRLTAPFYSKDSHLPAWRPDPFITAEESWAKIQSSYTTELNGSKKPEKFQTFQLLSPSSEFENPRLVPLLGMSPAQCFSLKAPTFTSSPQSLLLILPCSLLYLVDRGKYLEPSRIFTWPVTHSKHTTYYKDPQGTPRLRSPCPPLWDSCTGSYHCSYQHSSCSTGQLLAQRTMLYHKHRADNSHLPPQPYGALTPSYRAQW